MDAPAPPAVHREALGPVPLLRIDRPGPVVLELVLRVGAHDETLPTHGTTHLLEHLAAGVVGLTDPRVNAWTSPLFTGFTLTGAPGEVRELLARVVTALHDPPVAALERERRVLEAEAAQRGGWAGHHALAWRYGPRGPGLPVFREYGLRTAGAADLRAWAARTCTAGNAVAWCLAPAPVAAALDLPPGPRRAPAPAPEPVPVALPAETEHPGDGVTLSLVGADTLALRVGAVAIRDRALARLRTHRGLVYDVERHAESLDAELAHVVLGARTPEADPATVRDELLAAARAVAEGAAPDAVAAARAAARHVLAGPGNADELLRAAARHALLGHERADPAGRAAELAGLDDATVARAVAAALPGAVVLAPEGTRPGPLAPLELPVQAPAEGRVHRPRVLARSGRPDGHRVVVGADRVTARAGIDVATVRFADVVALVRRPGGVLHLVAADGTLAELRPGDVRDGDALVAAIEARVPADRLVPLDERETRMEAAAAPVSRLAGDTPDPVAALLAPDEPVLAVAEANRYARTGVLVLTDRRLLFSSRLLGEQVEVWPLASVERVGVRAGRLGGRLALTHEGERVAFGLSWPGQARALAAALQAASSTACASATVKRRS